jgi:hypothetical protein
LAFGNPPTTFTSPGLERSITAATVGPPLTPNTIAAWLPEGEMRMPLMAGGSA